MMTPELIHQAINAGLLVSLGFGLEHLRIRFHQKRKRQARRQSLGGNYRNNVEPVWANWKPEFGKALGRK